MLTVIGIRLDPVLCRLTQHSPAERGQHLEGLKEKNCWVLHLMPQRPGAVQVLTQRGLQSQATQLCCVLSQMEDSVMHGEEKVHTNTYTHTRTHTNQDHACRSHVI